MYKLWENGTPLYNEEYGQPEPTLTPYMAGTAGGTKAGCVIVCPGGGYGGRAAHEGEPIAQMYNAAGINAFVLNYRVKPYRHPAMLWDIQRAVRFVRYNAWKWNINPEKIAVLGFSAGGHLACTGVTLFDYGREDGDEIDRVSCRPDAGILCYPVVSFTEPWTHRGSMLNLLGPDAPEELMIQMSGEKAVRDDMPPVFFWHTGQDNGVPPENSIAMALAMQKKNLPYELHIFPNGRHGLGLAPSIPETAQWAPLSCTWLKSLGFGG